MRFRSKFVALVALMVALIAVPASAQAADPTSDYGSSTTWPWAGWWWPQLDSQNPNLYDDGQALSKYDQYVKATTGTAGTAQQWEKSNHFTADAKNDWWGHCHAWAAASIATKEPTQSVTKSGVTFTVDDQKGLLSELYFKPKTNWLSGTRYGYDAASTTNEAFEDIAPAWMDYLLRVNLGSYKRPFIMDINADEQVWNFPAFAYSRSVWSYQDGWRWVRTTVWYSNPKLNTVGHSCATSANCSYFSRTYTYWLKMAVADDGSESYASLGQWYGDSVKNHPDFAWMPTGRADMPHVKADVVGAITGQTL